MNSQTRELPAKWRKRNKAVVSRGRDYIAGRCDAREDCASELESALAAQDAALSAPQAGEFRIEHLDAEHVRLTPLAAPPSAPADGEAERLVDALADAAYNDAEEGRLLPSDTTINARAALIRRLAAKGEGVAFGHVYRVVANDETAARPWQDAGTVFVCGPAPVEGMRGCIQYMNLYAARAAASDGDRTDMGVLLEAYNAWPADIRKKLSLHDLRRMTGWRPTSERRASIDAMVDRFLAWELPQNFHPDNGIQFTAPSPRPPFTWPIGTNLFTAAQARAMFEHCIAATPPAPVPRVDEGMVERAAQAISARNQSNRGASYPIELCRADARAALTAALATEGKEQGR